MASLLQPDDLLLVTQSLARLVPLKCLRAMGAQRRS
jgi:hypothetical protein